jgi:hypothetical protein
MIAVPLIIVAVLGAALARWTRLHPLLVAGILALAGGGLGVVATVGFVGANPWPFGVMAIIVFGFIGALGAFMGWLRRKHVERTN